MMLCLKKNCKYLPDNMPVLNVIENEDDKNYVGMTFFENLNIWGMNVINNPLAIFSGWI